MLYYDFINQKIESTHKLLSFRILNNLLIKKEKLKLYKTNYRNVFKNYTTILKNEM